MAERIFSITELQRTGQGVTRETSLRFEWDARSHTVPEANISFGVRINTVREMYPGAVTPVEQVLSSEWKPFTVSGIWHDKFAGEGFAMGTYNAFEAMCMRGPLVRIAFEDLLYVGIITDFTPTYKRKAEISYSFTVSPHDRTNPAQASFLFGAERVFSTPPKTSRSLFKDSANGVAALGNLQASGPELQMSGTGFEDTGTAISDLESDVNELDLASSNNSLRAGINDFTREISIHRKIGSAAQDLALSVGKVRADLDQAYRSGVAALKVTSWASNIRNTSRSLALSSYDAEKDLRQRQNKKGVLRYRPSPGESVYQAAAIVYGDATMWRLIYEANGLQKLRFDGSEELIIPEASKP